MATGIPLPGLPGDALLRGVNTGSNMFSRIMQPIVQREQLAEQGKYHAGQLAHQKNALEQARMNHLENLAIQKQTQSRLAQMLPYQLQELKDKHAKMSPDYELNQIKNLYELAKQYGPQALNSTQSMPQPNEQLRNQLSSMGMFGGDAQMPQGQGAMPMEDNPGAPDYPVPEAPTSQQAAVMPNLMQMIVGGALKKHTGVNPFAPGKNATLTGAARDAESMEQLRQLHGADSPIVKEAESIQHAKQQQHEDLSAIRQRQLNGLNPGDTEIKDPQTGQTIGFRKQTTDKQKDAAKNTVLFNHLYPLVQGSANLSGPGSTLRFEQAARTYKTNPESRKIIDDLLIADKAASTTTVTEASRFNAGHTNQTFNRFVDTLKSEDIHKKLKKWIKEYEIPAEANIKADKRWQEELNKAEKLANKSIPATMDYYFDPDKQFEHQQKQLHGNNENNKKIVKYNEDTGRLE